MGDVVQVNFGNHNPFVTKKQLARHPEVRRSTRWIEQQVAEGMPPGEMRGHRRMFPLEDCLSWIARRRDERGAA